MRREDMILPPERHSEQQMREETGRALAQAARHMEAGRLPAARAELLSLELGTIDQWTLDKTDPWLRSFAGHRRIVASFDPDRRPADDEVVIIYGNYPHFFGNLVVHDTIRRHSADFPRFRHDSVESDQRWAGVDRIYVINLDERPDRYDGVLRELTSAKAPLERLTRVSASGPRPDDPEPIGRPLACLRSHMEAIQSAIDGDAEHVLIMEDDFTFTSDLDVHLSDLSAFLERRYDYWVCLVATSKYGQILPKDDLVNVSYQECTNAGGYMLSRAGALKLLALYQDAHEQMAKTSDLSYAADRCWTVLQPSGKFLVFRRKWGFQAAGFSDIERAISRYMD